MVNKPPQRAANSWTTRRDEKRRRIESVRSWMQGPILSQEKIVDALELLVKSGDRVVLEGDNQKQADFLSRSLVKVDPKKLQDLHLIISSISRPEHLTLFEWQCICYRPNMSANAKVSEKPLVCLVDDDSLIRDSTVRLIRALGFRVEAFASAEEFAGSGYLKETACLILDVRMPGMDGLELQHHLSAAGERIPIIFITAHADDEQERRAMEAGAVGFLYKAFSQESLLQAVRSALGEQPGET